MPQESMSINRNLIERIPKELMGLIISSPYLAKLELMVANVLLPSKCDTPISVYLSNLIPYNWEWNKRESPGTFHHATSNMDLTNA